MGKSVHTDELLQPHEMAQIATVVAAARKRAGLVPLLVLWAVLLSVAQLTVGFLEYELTLQLFTYIAGEGGQWTPAVLALTGIIFLIAFHRFAADKPEHFVVRLVLSIARVLIPVYMIGLGLLVAGILWVDGLGGLVAPAPGLSLLVEEVARV